MYYCPAHQVAWEDSRQFQGHWLHAHQNESRPTSESVYVSEVPEGTKIASPPKARRPRSSPPPPPPPGNGVGAPSSSPVGTSQRPTPQVQTFTYADEDETHLDQLLDSIGVPLAQRQTIVKGWRNFPILHQHPGNLDNHIMSIVGPKFRGSVQLVVHAMFPGAEPEAAAPQYMYGQPSYGRPGSMFWPESARWSGQRPSDGFYEPRYYRPMPGSAEELDANPQVVALQKQVSDILEALKDERAERAEEKREQLQKERDAAWQTQLNALATKMDGSLSALVDEVKVIGQQVNQGRTTAEASQAQRLTEEVSALKDTIVSNREAQLQGTVDSLRDKLVEVDQKVNREPPGKTTEDLVAQGVPLVVGELRSIGNMVGGELRGIRAQAGEGKLPGLAPLFITPPQEKPGGSANPAVVAEQVVAIRGLEDEILQFVGHQSRS